MPLNLIPLITKFAHLLVLCRELPGIKKGSWPGNVPVNSITILREISLQGSLLRKQWSPKYDQVSFVAVFWCTEYRILRHFGKCLALSLVPGRENLFLFSAIYRRFPPYALLHFSSPRFLYRLSSHTSFLSCHSWCGTWLLLTWLMDRNMEK